MVKKCIFCGADSSGSKSVEHIIPESLGNKEYVLPRGVVCDKCNNYFARKIEGPVLSLDGFRQLRFYSFIENKEGRIPTSDALICGDRVKAKWIETGAEEHSLLLEVDPKTVYKIIKNPPKMFITRGYDLRDDENHRYDISRFLAKLAIEYFVYLNLDELKEEGEEANLIFDDKLTRMIHFVRFGRNDFRPLDYKVYKKSMGEKDYVISLKFESSEDQLIFVLRINETFFELNLTNNAGL